jgi:hypothetical protein
MNFHHGAFTPSVNVDKVYLDTGFIELSKEGNHLICTILSAGKWMVTGQAPDEIGGKNFLADSLHITAIKAFVHSLHGRYIGMCHFSAPLLQLRLTNLN